MMNKMLFLLAAAALFAGVLSGCVAQTEDEVGSKDEAITYGELDDGRHPGVVLILMEVNGVPMYRCSGTLIREQVVLTAGHCTGEPGEFSGMRVYTDDDVDYATSPYVRAQDWATHPQYTSASFVRHDVGVIILDEKIALGDKALYGRLPQANQFDSLKPGAATRFTAVGYGLQRINPVFVEAERVRMLSQPHLIQINTPGFTGDFSFLLSNNAATGGTCFGDSGGPNFFGDTNIIAGVTSFGINGNCAGTGGVFRLDRAHVLEFINSAAAGYL